MEEHMIKMFTAYTTEVDDVDEAIAEIFAQLDLNSLSSNSVGIVACCPDFVDSGILEVLSEKLPFDFVGATTMASASNNEYNMYGLSLTVLSSDSIGFQTSFSEHIEADAYKEPLSAAYQDAFEKRVGVPSLILAYLPLIPQLAGTFLLNHLDGICGDTPIFGTVSGDVSMTMQNCYTFRGAQRGKQNAAFILFYGDVSPRFITSSLPEKNVGKQTAIVTESVGNIVKKVNGVKLSEYLRSIGIQPRLESGIGAIQELFMVDYGNAAERVALRVFTVLENGDAIFNDVMPQGASIAIGHVSRESVIESAQDALRQILDGGDMNGVLIYPCMSRYLFLSPNREIEMQTVRECLRGKVPYSLSYSGGELCPIYTGGGKMQNHIHGDTFTACVF
jgi:hypothetical protein